MKARTLLWRSVASTAMLATSAGTLWAQPALGPDAPPVVTKPTFQPAPASPVSEFTPPAGLTTAPVPAPTPPAQPGRLAAVVNGEPIPVEEVELFLKQRPVPPQLSDEQRRQLKMEVVGMIVDDHLLQQFLRGNTPAVKEDEINKWLAELEKTLKSQGHTLAEFYKERGLSEQRVRQNVCMLRGQLREPAPERGRSSAITRKTATSSTRSRCGRATSCCVCRRPRRRRRSRRPGRSSPR